MEGTFYFFLCMLSALGYSQEIIIDDIRFRGRIESIHVVDTCRGNNIKYTFDNNHRIITTVLNDNYDSRSIYLYEGNNLIAEQQFLNGIVTYQLVHQYQGNNLINNKEFVKDNLKLEERYFYKGNQLVEMQQILGDSVAYTERYR